MKTVKLNSSGRKKDFCTYIVLTGIIFAEIWTNDSNGPQTTANRSFIFFR